MNAAVRTSWASSLLLGAVLAGLVVTPALGAARYQPDGRIRLGTGTWVGNIVYNTTGYHQTSTTLMLIPTTSAAYLRFTFGISIRNAGTASDRFTIRATGAATPYFAEAYRHGSTSITSAIVAGTYRTPWVLPGATYLVTVSVQGSSAAVAGSFVTRLVTITSTGDPTRKDAVKFVVKTLAV